jgi:hypothetical protein
VTGERPPKVTREQTLWAAAASALFLIALALLGYAIASGVILPFAIGWVLLQAFGYVGALRFAKGDLAHPLFKSQVMLHLIGLALLLALVFRG